MSVIAFLSGAVINVIGIIWSLVLLLQKLDNPAVHTWTTVGTPALVCSMVAIILAAIGVLIFIIDD